MYVQSQQVLDNLSQWSHDWQLYSNMEKCKALHISLNQHHRHYRLWRDFITTSVDCYIERDLVILIDDKLKFHVRTQLQRSSVAAKANKLLGIICQSFEYIITY